MGSRPYLQLETLPLREGVVLEIGSERNEGSTSYLSQLCQHNKKFYTVDIDKDQYIKALQITGGHGAYNLSGEEFLGNIFPLLNEKIAFAYLDNFDLLTHDGRDWTERKGLYRSYGLELNNTNARIAHMTQAILVERFAAERCYICFDDTWISDITNEYDGKGAWAIRPLEHAGFKIVNEVCKGNERFGLKHGYVLMLRDKNVSK